MSGKQKTPKPSRHSKGSSQESSRRSKPKLFCEDCNDHLDGFRGRHELQRHINRAHKAEVKGWICVEPAAEGKISSLIPTRPLNTCKACVNGHLMAAQAQAVVHLRMVHFAPVELTRKQKIAGHSRLPPKVELMPWLKEITVPGTQQVSSVEQSHGKLDEPGSTGTFDDSAVAPYDPNDEVSSYLRSTLPNTSTPQASTSSGVPLVPTSTHFSEPDNEPSDYGRTGIGDFFFENRQQDDADSGMDAVRVDEWAPRLPNYANPGGADHGGGTSYLVGFDDDYTPTTTAAAATTSQHGQPQEDRDYKDEETDKEYKEENDTFDDTGADLEFPTERECPLCPESLHGTSYLEHWEAKHDWWAQGA